MKHSTQTIIYLCALLMPFSAFAQSPLYMPIEFQEAYEKGSRNWDGRVSPSYWQNRSEYDIKATVDPHAKLLKGEATIIYYNNSPDTLRYPTFQTYHDLYRPNSKNASRWGTLPVTDGVVIHQLKVNGKEYDLKTRDSVWHNGTNYIFRLANPLLPKKNIKIEISWEYTIPGDGALRSGVIDSTSMFIGYWYPEMAVYDDIDGWDRIVYDGGIEFYHDYSDYQVEITLPDNFMVWASVPPNNKGEVYSPTIHERLALARNSSDPVTIYKEDDFRKTSSTNKTWKYTAKDFPDFSFALSDHFLWDAAAYKDHTGDYFFHVAYPANHPEFAAEIGAMEKSLEVFHTQFPVYPFPYKYFTLINGFGPAMEFVGMVNMPYIPSEVSERWLGKKVSAMETQLWLTSHEMGHNYFPFFVGINEKKYAWMDEGMANLPGYFADDALVPPLFSYSQNENKPDWGSQNIVPMMTPSNSQGEGYMTNSYNVAFQSYLSLHQLLGKELFFKCLHNYMDEWKHKHPTPYDFMFIFNRISGLDLNWFWKKWYFDWGYIDVGITSVNENTITIENKGGRPLAFNVITTFEDGTTMKDEISPKVWKTATIYHHRVNTGSKKIKKVLLEIPQTGDVNGQNNVWGG